MSPGAALDLAVLAAVSFAAMLGFSRGLAFASLSVLIFINLLFAAEAIANSSLPINIYLAVSKVPSKENMNSAVILIKVAIYAVSIGFVLPLFDVFVFRVQRQFAARERPALWSRMGGTGVALIQCGAMLIAIYTIVGLVFAPKDWSSSLKQSYSVDLIYATGSTVSTVLPENLRPDVKPFM